MSTHDPAVLVEERPPPTPSDTPPTSNQLPEQPTVPRRRRRARWRWAQLRGFLRRRSYPTPSHWQHPEDRVLRQREMDTLRTLYRAGLLHRM